MNPEQSDILDNPNDFAKLGQTWSRQASLEMGSYDPYPELLNPVQKALEKMQQNSMRSREAYCGHGDNSCNQGYASSYGIKPKSSVPNMNYSVGVAQENFSNAGPCPCASGPYNSLDQTWGRQRWYNWN